LAAPNDEEANIPIISNSVIKVLDQNLGEFMTVSAIKTVGYYMVEFHDEVSNDWMTNFMNYSTNGFPDNDWTKYLDHMIELPPRSIDVTLEHTKRTRNPGNAALATNVSLHYIHELEPRKIAHRIVAVREDISNELMQDLCTIKLENQAAMKYANTWLSVSRDEAEAQRTMTRSAEIEGSTPYRNRNFFECSVLLTNIALDLVKAELRKNDDTSALEELDNILHRLDDQESALEALDQLVYKTRGPRTLIEELCYTGLKQGVSSSKQANFLRMAQNIMDTRYALSIEASKLLASQCALSRQYYKKIKDLGGFRLFESKRPQFFLVDSRKKKEEEDAAAKAVIEASKVVENTTTSIGASSETKQDTAEEATALKQEVEEYNPVLDPVEGMMGPLMM